MQLQQQTRCKEAELSRQLETGKQTITQLRDEVDCWRRRERQLTATVSDLEASVMHAYSVVLKLSLYPVLISEPCALPRNCSSQIF